VPSNEFGPYRGLSGIGGESPAISMLNVPVGWRYYIIAVW